MKRETELGDAKCRGLPRSTPYSDARFTFVENLLSLGRLTAWRVHLSKFLSQFLSMFLALYTSIGADLPEEQAVNKPSSQAVNLQQMTRMCLGAT